MKTSLRWITTVCALSVACGSDPMQTDPGAQTEEDSGAVHSSKDSGTHATSGQDSGSVHTDAGSHSTPDPVVDAGKSTVEDAGTHDAGTHDGSVAQPSDASVSHDAAVTGSTTALTGTLGALGAVKPTVSSWVISNSGETRIYLTSALLTCEQLKVSRWLGTFTTDAQVVEIVVRGNAPVGKASNPEVNFAAGGKSSAYETAAATATVTFTKSEAMGVIEGTVSATYRPSGDVMGTFHAEFCAGGQGY
jgi:hypothetical protein